MRTRTCLWAAFLMVMAGSAWAQPAQPRGGDDDSADELSMDDGPAQSDMQRGPRRGPPGDEESGQRGGRQGMRRGGGPGMQPGGGPGMRPGGGPAMDGQGPMGMRGAGEQPEALTEAQEKELTAFLKETDPKMSERMGSNGREAPMMQHRRLAMLWKVYQDPEARGLFVKRTKASAAVRELAAEYRKAGEKEKPAIKEKLAKATGELFDADQGNKELQLKKMQENISKLKGKLEKRRQLKDKIVSRRVEQLTGEGDDW